MDPASESAAAALIDQLAERGFHLVAIAAGGGSGAVAALAGTPGASRSLLEGLVPHAREAVDRLLGGAQETYCSSRAARRLAMHGWSQARLLGSPAKAVRQLSPEQIGALERSARHYVENAERYRQSLKKVG